MGIMGIRVMLVSRVFECRRYNMPVINRCPHRTFFYNDGQKQNAQIRVNRDFSASKQEIIFVVL